MTRIIPVLVFLVPSLVIGQGGQPSVTGVVFNPSSVPGGRPATATVTLSGPAPNNGFEVSLSMTSNVAQLAASAVTIGGGQTSATVQVTTTATSTSQLAVLNATARGATRSANLTITPPAAVTLTLAPASVTAGQQATGTITLDGPAPAGGTTVTLASSSASATVPATTTISQGQTSRAFSVNTSAVTAQATATITATAGSASRTATLTVAPPPISIESITLPSNLKTGESATFVFRSTAPAPAGGLGISFTSSGVELFGASGIVTSIDAGQTAKSHTVTLPRTDRDKPFTITARANGIATSKSGTLIGPRITSMELSDSVDSGRRAQLAVRLDAPSSFLLPVNITSNNAAITSPGNTSGSSTLSPSLINYFLESNPVTRRTVVTITLTHAGESRTDQIIVLPAAPLLATFTASPTGARAGGSIVLTATLDRPALNGSLTFALSATDLPVGMALPATLTVPAGATSASVTVATPSRMATSAFPVITAKLFGVGNKSVQVRIDP